MRLISDEQPPGSTDPDLAEWLTRRVTEINAGLQQTQDFTPVYAMPGHQYTGMVRYFGAAVLPDIPGEGLYIKLSIGWQQL